MSDQQYISFSGFSSDVRIFSAEYTITDGITPGTGVLVVAPQFGGLVDIAGTLILGIGSSAVAIQDGLIIDSQIQANTGGQNVILTFVDGRHWWQPENGGGEITGVYNVRKANGDVDSNTEKTPRELATMLLNEMPRVTSFNVDAMPNDIRPYMDWSEPSNPAQELAKLCDLTNCRIAYWIDGTVTIVQAGFGALLDPSYPSEARSVALQIRPRPDKIKVYGAETYYQVRIPLEPVMLDNDGTWKARDDVSYKPSDGWESEDPGFCGGVTENQTRHPDGSLVSNRELAVSTLWRCFRPREDLTDVFSMIPELQGREIHREDILPLITSTLAETVTDAEGIESPKPAYLSGEFYHHGRPDVVNSAPGTRCELPFSIDEKRGIITLPQYVVKLGDDVNREYEDPVLDLVIAVRVKDDETRAPMRYSKERTMPGIPQGTGTKILRQDDIRKTVVVHYRVDPFILPLSVEWDGQPPTVNDTDCDNAANYYLDAAMQYYDRPDTAQDVNPWIRTDVRIDGAIRQITWSVDVSGGATTQVSRGTQHDMTVPPFKERRRRELQSIFEQSKKDVKLQKLVDLQGMA